MGFCGTNPISIQNKAKKYHIYQNEWINRLILVNKYPKFLYPTIITVKVNIFLYMVLIQSPRGNQP